MSEEEEIRDIADHDGYIVSNLGRVGSFFVQGSNFGTKSKIVNGTKRLYVKEVV